MPTLADCLARRSNDLAAVRILAATAVLWAHAWAVTIPGLRTADYFHVFAFSLDWHGVHAFFILSGLLLTRSILDKPDLISFTVARLMRYVPAMLVAAAIAALVVGPIATTAPLGDYFGSAAPFRFILEIATLSNVSATLPGVFGDAAQPGILFIPLWTIHYELVFALCLGVAGRLGLLRRKALVALGLIVIVTANLGWFRNGEGYPELGSPHHFVRFATTFGLGIALAVFAERVPVSNRLLLALALVAAPLAFSPVAAISGMLLLAYAILCIGFLDWPFGKALARLGAWSYGFYVFGFLIEQCVAAAFPAWNGWGVFLAAFVLALGAGAASWAFVEKPALGWVGPVAAALRRLTSWGARAPEAKAAERTR